LCVVAALAIGFAAACAGKRPATLADRFVHQGAPGETAMVLDLPLPAAADSPREVAAGIPRQPVPKQAATVPDVSTVDPELRAALAALTASPGAETHAAVADAYRQLGIYDLAASALDRAIDLAPRDAGLHDRLARVLRDDGQAGLALGSAHRATFFAPRSPEASNTLGTVLFALGQIADARAEFQRALALDPGADYARRNLCLIDQGGTAECGERLRGAAGK
jgi:Flp pilus assembly protein TadD